MGITSWLVWVVGLHSSMPSCSPIVFLSTSRCPLLCLVVPRLCRSQYFWYVISVASIPNAFAITSWTFFAYSSGVRCSCFRENVTLIQGIYPLFDRLIEFYKVRPLLNYVIYAIIYLLAWMINGQEFNFKIIDRSREQAPYGIQVSVGLFKCPGNGIYSIVSGISDSDWLNRDSGYKSTSL